MEKEASVNTFVYSNFNYCSLVWHFTTKKSTNKTEKIQERYLKLLYNNTTETYDDVLIKTWQSSMEIKRLRTFAMEIFKTLNDLNPNYMKEIKKSFIFLLMKHIRNMTYLFIVVIKQNMVNIL